MRNYKNIRVVINVKVKSSFTAKPSSIHFYRFHFYFANSLLYSKNVMNVNYSISLNFLADYYYQNLCSIHSLIVNDFLAAMYWHFCLKLFGRNPRKIK